MANEKNIGGKAREMFTQYNGYLETAPVSGGGNAEVTWNTYKENSGRNSRSDSAKYRDRTSGGLSVTLNLIQKGKPVFLSLKNPTEAYAIDGETKRVYYDVSPDGESISFTGTTNAKKLRYAVDEDSYDVVFDMQYSTPISSTYTANGASASNNTNIPSDPGATRDFSFSIPLTVLENLTPNGTSGSFSIYAYGDDDSIATTIHVQLHQKVGDSFLWIDKTGTTEATIELEYTAGSTGSVSIISNTNWELVM